MLSPVSFYVEMFKRERSQGGKLEVIFEAYKELDADKFGEFLLECKASYQGR